MFDKLISKSINYYPETKVVILFIELNLNSRKQIHEVHNFGSAQYGKFIYQVFRTPYAHLPQGGLGGGSGGGFSENFAWFS